MPAAGDDDDDVDVCVMLHMSNYSRQLEDRRASFMIEMTCCMQVQVTDIELFDSIYWYMPTPNGTQAMCMQGR